MKIHFLNWWPLYLLIGWIVLGLTAMAMFAQGANPARSYGALDVIETTNFAGVTFASVPCPHPGCGDSHSVLATERYQTVRDTWAEVVDAAGTPTGENKRLHSITNDWGSLVQEIAHPAIYHMHTQPGYPVRPGTRWPGDLPPLPPWETADAGKEARRSNVAMLPGDANSLFGILYGTGSTNVLEKRSTDRSSGVRVWPGDAVERVTNTPDVRIRQAHGIYLPGDRIWVGDKWATVAAGLTTNTVDGSTLHRFRAVPATNALPQARRFNP